MKTLIRATVATSLVAVTVGVSVGTLNQSAPKAAAQEAPADAQAPARNALGVFRGGGPTAKAGEVEKIQGALAAARGIPDTVEGSDVHLAREDGTYAIHVALGHKSLCLAVRQASGSGSLNCGRLPSSTATTEARRPIFAVDGIGRDQYRVSGIVLDGVTDVSVAAKNSDKPAIGDVVNNVFSIVTSGEPTSLHLRLPDGSEVDLPILG